MYLDDKSAQIHSQLDAKYDSSPLEVSRKQNYLVIWEQFNSIGHEDMHNATMCVRSMPWPVVQGHLGGSSKSPTEETIDGP